MTQHSESRSLRSIAQRFLDAFKEDPGHSDLDREQPINICVTLGDLRDLRWALAAKPSETLAPYAWIPVIERKPQTYDTVLIVDGDGIMSTGYWTGKEWSIDLHHESDPQLTPMHWMTLPNPPTYGLLECLKHEMKKREDVAANRQGEAK